MRKFLLTAVAISAAIVSNAQSEQTFKAFKVDLALGYAIPAGSGSKGGALLAIEPKYAINDQLTLGLRMETAITAQGTMQNGQMTDGDVKGSGSYLATGDYYFNTNGFRPFIGAGVGMFTNASANLNSSSSEIETARKFGFMPRAGFETGHFRTAIEYNIAGKSGTVNHNYLGIKLGFFFGGGRLDN